MLVNSTELVLKNFLKSLQQLPDIQLVLYYSNLDPDGLRGAGVDFFPQNFKKDHMGYLLSQLGYEPIIRLQSGGLKAAQLALTGQTDFNGETLALAL